MLSLASSAHQGQRPPVLGLLAGIVSAIHGGIGSRRLRIAARSALLVDYRSGEVLFAQNPDSPSPPASITKLMTLRLAYMALRTGQLRLADKVPVRASASADNPAFRGASLMYLQAGETVTVEELMKGLAIPSACDAAVAMAELLAGSVPAFVAEMNAEAHRLGMSHTRFVDPHGLSNQNQTTASDLVLLARKYIQDEPESLTRLHSLPGFSHRSRTLCATNLLLGRYQGVDGLKTGFLEAAGYHQITTAVRGENRLIGIVLGTASKKARRDQSAALLDYGFGLLKGAGIAFSREDSR